MNQQHGPTLLLPPSEQTLLCTHPWHLHGLCISLCKNTHFCNVISKILCSRSVTFISNVQKGIRIQRPKSSVQTVGMAKPRHESMRLDVKFHVCPKAPGIPLHTNICCAISPFQWGMMGTSSLHIQHNSVLPPLTSKAPMGHPATPAHPCPSTPTPAKAHSPSPMPTRSH